MRLINSKALEKLKRKNLGNVALCIAIDKLLMDFELSIWETPLDIIQDRPDADCVHSDGFYFFNLSMHRTMILVELKEQEASVVWVGTHDAYERIFKNSKSIIRKWLKSNDWIG